MHTIELTRDFNHLRFFVESPQGDTTLIINGPGGLRCNDDAVGLQPEIAASFPAGRYSVWVGSYSSGQTIPYQLHITEYRRR